MNSIINTTQINEFVQQIQPMKDKLDTINEQMNNYLKFMKNNNKFEKKENESKEDALKRAESMLDRLIEIEEQQNELKENSQQVLEMIETMKKKIDKIQNECEENDDNLFKTNIEIIDEIIEMRRMIMEEKNLELKKEIEMNNNNFEMNKGEFLKIKEKIEKKREEKRKRKEAEERRRKEEEKKQTKLESMKIDENEFNQLEQWTNKKCSEIVYDVGRDGYPKNNSIIFEDKVKGKSYLVFLVEDIGNNKYGYYFNGTMNRVGETVKTEGSFMFSLNSNGRFNEMMKFEEKDSCKGLQIYNKSHERLFCVDGGIIIYKETNKSSNNVREFSSCFDFHGKTKIFHPELKDGNWKKITLKRFVVIQMK